ncbi:YjbH domain-containing protein, partial [Vibrio parahaemolyticus]|uniref:YjbH domain-containing protein n=1 Tax=Vibrio parahaemolyticus TaxID=670 RepID=UPI0032AFD6EF
MNLIRTSLSLSLMGPALVWAQDVPFEAPPLQPSQMDFGGVGLMQMPTGRMAPEGEFNFAVTGSDEYLFYNVTLQVMPWFSLSRSANGKAKLTISIDEPHKLDQL